MLYSNNSLSGSRQKLEVFFLGNPGDELGIDFANIYIHSKTNNITPAMVFGLTFSTAIAFMSMVTLLLIGLQYRFGWIPFLRFVTPRRSKRKAARTSPSDEIMPYPKDLLPQFSPTRPNGTPTAITFTEISEYPFSTSDYYAQTSFSEARTKSSGEMTSSTPRTHGSARVARTPKSANSVSAIPFIRYTSTQPILPSFRDPTSRMVPTWPQYVRLRNWSGKRPGRGHHLLRSRTLGCFGMQITKLPAAFTPNHQQFLPGDHSQWTS